MLDWENIAYRGYKNGNAEEIAYRGYISSLVADIWKEVVQFTLFIRRVIAINFER